MEVTSKTSIEDYKEDVPYQSRGDTAIKPSCSAVLRRGVGALISPRSDHDLRPSISFDRVSWTMIVSPGASLCN